MTTPNIVRKVLKLKHENPALFAWEIRDLLRKEMLQSRSSSDHPKNLDNMALSVPSISSINRILRTGFENKSINWSFNSPPNPSSSNSSAVINYPSNLIYYESSNKPISSNDYPKKRRKFTSYKIEDILRKDEDEFFKPTEVLNPISSSSNLRSTESEKYVTNTFNTNETNICYSYYYQAFLAAYYNHNQFQNLKETFPTSSK